MTTIDSMGVQDICELDEKLRKCAQLAMKPYLKKIDYSRASEGTGNVEKTVLRNMGGYFKALDELKRVRFPKMYPERYEHLKEEIEFTLADMIGYLREEDRTAPQMAIVMPVGFYAVVINHCFNKAAREKRKDRAKDGKEGQYSHHELCRIIRGVSGEKTKDKKRFYDHEVTPKS